MYSKALTIANYCQILAQSSQIKFGVLSPCVQIGKNLQQLIVEADELKKLAGEKNATQEELKEEINFLDEKWILKFPKIKKSLIEDIGKEMLPAYQDGKKIEINILEILTFLESNSIVQ